MWPLPYTVVWLQGRGTLALGEGGTSLLWFGRNTAELGSYCGLSAWGVVLVLISVPYLCVFLCHNFCLVTLECPSTMGPLPRLLTLDLAM